MSRMERLAGWVSMHCLMYLARAALRRGDLHEAEHCAAALRAGDTSHMHVTPCLARTVLHMGKDGAA